MLLFICLPAIAVNYTLTNNTSVTVAAFYYTNSSGVYTFSSATNLATSPGSSNTVFSVSTNGSSGIGIQGTNSSLARLTPFSSMRLNGCNISAVLASNTIVIAGLSISAGTPTSIASGSGFNTNRPGTNVASAAGFNTNRPGTNVASSAFNTNRPGTNIASSTGFNTNVPSRHFTVVPLSTNITVGSTNILVAFGEFTNYADKFYWNTNFQFTDNAGTVTGAYTNGSAIQVSDGGAPGRVFVGISGNVGGFVGSEPSIGNDTYYNATGDNSSITNGWPGTYVGITLYPSGDPAGPYTAAGSYFRFQQPATNITYTTNYP